MAEKVSQRCERKATSTNRQAASLKLCYTCNRQDRDEKYSNCGMSLFSNFISRYNTLKFISKTFTSLVRVTLNELRACIESVMENTGFITG